MLKWIRSLFHRTPEADGTPKQLRLARAVYAYQRRFPVTYQDWQSALDVYAADHDYPIDVIMLGMRMANITETELIKFNEKVQQWHNWYSATINVT